MPAASTASAVESLDLARETRENGAGAGLDEHRRCPSATIALHRLGPADRRGDLSA